MPRPLRTWQTPVVLALATALVMTLNAAAVLAAQRLWRIDLVIEPRIADGVLAFDAAAVAVASGIAAAAGGALLVFLVRPCKPRFLLRSAAGQGASCAVVLAVLLSSPVHTELLYGVLAMIAAMVPAVALARLARPRLAEYRRIPRLGELHH